MQKTYLKIWLVLSSFGIMFAILSWIQEGGLIPNNMGGLKGFLAIACGAILYLILPKNLN